MRILQFNSEDLTEEKINRVPQVTHGRLLIVFKVLMVIEMVFMQHEF